MPLGGSANAGTIAAYAKLDTSGIVTGVNKAKSELTSLTASMQKTAAQMRSIGQAMSLGLTLPIIGLGKAVVDTAVQIDSLKRGLTAVMGSADAASREMVKLREVAKLPGLGLREAYEGSLNLQAAGFSANEARKNLLAFGNALGTVGKGKAEMDRVTLALTQLANRTSGFGQEIRQLQEALPQIRQMMMQAFGTADSELLGKMGITGRQFVDAIATEFEKLPAVTSGARNALENFSDTLTDLRQAIGDAVLPMLTRAMEALEPAVKSVASWFKQLTPQAQTFFSVFSVALAVGGPVLMGLSALANGLATIRNGLALIAGMPAFKWLAARAGIALAEVGGAVAAPLVAAAGVGLAIDAFNKPGSQFPSAGGRARGMDEAQFGKPGASKLTPDEQAAYEAALIRGGGSGFVGDVFRGDPREMLYGKKAGPFKPKFILPLTAEQKAAAKARQEGLNELKRLEIKQKSEFDAQIFDANVKRMENYKILSVSESNRIYQLEVDEIEKNRKEAQTQQIAKRQAHEKEFARKAEALRKTSAEEDKKSVESSIELTKRAYKDAMGKDLFARAELLEQYAKDSLISESNARAAYNAGIKNLDAELLKTQKEDAKKRIEEYAKVREREAVSLKDMTWPKLFEGSGKLGLDAEGRQTIRPHDVNLRMPGSSETPADTSLTQSAGTLLKKRDKFNIDTFRDSLRKEFDFVKEFGSNMADEFYSSFSEGLQKIFGKNPLGRALARTLDKWFSGMLDQALVSIFSPKGTPKGMPAPGQSPAQGNQQMGKLNNTIMGLTAALSATYALAGAGKQPLSQTIGGLGGAIGFFAGGPAGAAIGTAAGGLFAGLGSILGFDDPVNDKKAYHWGRDFGTHFSRGAMDTGRNFRPAGAGAGGNSNTSINLHMPGMIVRETADIDYLAERLAWRVTRALPARPGRR